MAEESLKSKTVKGVLWSGIGQYSTFAIQFIISIILARLLTPDQYGLIGMIGVFTAIVNIFIDCGFATSLVRKPDHNQTDFSTLFYFNLVASFVGYIIIFLISPWIAEFYNEPILEPIAKVQALNIIIGSFCAVQDIQYTIKMNFKTISKFSFVCTIISGVVGIIMAYSGFGVWALVIQGLTKQVLYTLCYWYFSSWRPSWEFSRQTMKYMWNFGNKMLLSSLLNTIFNNIYTLVIGRVYSARDLGNYSRANHYAQLASSQLNSIFSDVSFPMLCSIQNDMERLARVYRQYLRVIAFIVFPLMVGMSAVAKPLIIVMLTEKWIDVVELLQIICLSMMWYPVHSINLSLLQVKGRSDLFLRLEVIKKIIIVIVMCITVPISIKAMVIGSLCTSLICLFINTYYTGKLINVGYLKQMKDLLPILLLALFMGLCVYIITHVVPGYLLQLIIGVISGMIIYVGIAYLFKMSELTELLTLIKLRKK